MELRDYDREGHPVSKAQRQSGRRPGMHIAYTDTIRYARRITFAAYWLDTAGAAEPARSFHTDGEIRRSGASHRSYRQHWGWASVEAARAGHLEIVGWLSRVAAWLAMATDQVFALPQVPAALQPGGRAARAAWGERQ